MRTYLALVILCLAIGTLSPVFFTQSMVIPFVLMGNSTIAQCNKFVLDLGKKIFQLTVALLPCSDVSRSDQSFTRRLQRAGQVVDQIPRRLDQLRVLDNHDVGEGIAVLKKMEQYFASNVKVMERQSSMDKQKLTIPVGGYHLAYLDQCFY